MIRVNLEWLMADRGVSMEELAARVDIARKNLWALKANHARAIRFDTLAKLCAALRCTPGDLLECATEREAVAAPREDRPPREAHEQAVLDALADGPLVLDDVITGTGLSASEVARAVLRLELADLVDKRGPWVHPR